MHALIVYQNRDNEEDIVLLAGGAVYDSTPVTRWILTVGAVTLDTAVSSDWISWPFDCSYQGAAVKGARLMLGSKGLAAGVHAGCRLVVYDGSGANGVVWSDGLQVRVVA